MEPARATELIQRQIEEAHNGSPDNFGEWRNRTEVVLRTVFGEGSVTLKKFGSVKYSPGIYFSGMDTSGYQTAGVRQVISILESAKLEIEISTEAADQSDESGTAPVLAATRVFIVHGQDDAKKYELEAYLQKLVAEPPIILHQQPNGGRVLIEKFEESAAAVGYAVVLLTADDVGRPASLESQDDRPRGRQSVVFEMGFFIGLIGRKRVAVLYDEGVELPSDINGLVYIALDSAGAWKGKLAAEISHVGIEVDWTAIGRS
ncbi:TIR domain-containing protein [Nesterenkonia populi]